MCTCRYEIEQQLLKGEISIDDIPKLWNAKMQEYLGCTPKNDAEGCLQDVHWSAGIMGYFPTYSLGAMYACQIYQVHIIHANDHGNCQVAQNKSAWRAQWLLPHIQPWCSVCLPSLILIST